MMKGTVWRAFAGSLVLFLLACGACDYGARETRRISRELAAEGFFVCGGADVFPSEWQTFGAMLFIASVSVAGGGAMRWWRVEFDGEADVRALVLGIGGTAATVVEAIEEAQDAAREEVPAREEVAALTTSSVFPEDAQHFEHFDEQGRSPLERVMAQY